MNPFSNKKQKKQFNKLDKASKKAAMELAIQNEVGKALAKKVSQAIVDGMDLQSNHLYKKYVSQIDSGNLSEEEKQDCIEHLLSSIRTGNLNYVKRHGKEEEKEREEEEQE